MATVGVNKEVSIITVMLTSVLGPVTTSLSLYIGTQYNPSEEVYNEEILIAATAVRVCDEYGYCRMFQTVEEFTCL